MQYFPGCVCCWVKPTAVGFQTVTSDRQLSHSVAAQARGERGRGAMAPSQLGKIPKILLK